MSFCGFCQPVNADVINKFDNSEEMIYLNRNYISHIKLVNKKISINHLYKESALYVSKNSLLSNKRRIYSSDLSPVKNIKTEQYNFNGRKYQKIKVDNPEVSLQPHAESFYDDTKVYTITFNNIKTNSVVKYEYETEYKEPRLFKMFYVDDFYNTEVFSNTIKCDKNIKLCFEYYNISKDDFEYSEKEDGKYILYTWKKTNLKKIDYKKNNINYKHYCAAIGARICEIKINDSLQNYLKNTSDLYFWYSRLTNEISNNAYQDVKKLTDSITQHCNSDLEKLKLIYYYVQDNISYIAIEDGMSGFVPRTPDFVLKNKIGDCKDMATLVFNMAKSQNIKCHLTWVGTREIPFKYQENPTVFNDNHMIASYIDKDKKIYFLDATSKYNPFEFHSSMIQGKEGLIGIDEKNFQVSEIPVIESKNNLIIDTIITTLTENLELKGKRNLYASGFERIELIYQNNYNSNKHTFLNNLHKNIILANNKTKYFNSTYIDNKKENYFKVYEDIYINNYINEINTEYIFNPIILKSVFDFVSSLDYNNDFTFENLFQKNYYFETQLPSNYNLVSMPTDKFFVDKDFSYSISYKFENEKIKANLIYSINTLLVNNANKKKWVNFTDSLITDLNQSVVFKKHITIK